jgi:tryptophan synthase alpha chain
MNRIDAQFQKLRRENRKGFVAYITAGDPNLRATAALAQSFERIGVDVLELGVPFSDPLADGVVNQLAAERALRSGTTLRTILQTVKQLRRDGCEVPIVLFTYFNPVHAYRHFRGSAVSARLEYGQSRRGRRSHGISAPRRDNALLKSLKMFVADAADAGVDGLLPLDLPPEEETAYRDAFGDSNLRLIHLIAPTTPEARIQEICRHSSGFIYYVSREGVTGMQKKMSDTIRPRVALIQKHTDLPVAVGFGISSPQQARAVAACGDAVVVGSAIVTRIGDIGDKSTLVPRITKFVESLVQSVKAK